MQEDRDYNENKDPENVPENGSGSDVTGVSEKAVLPKTEKIPNSTRGKKAKQPGRPMRKDFPNGVTAKQLPTGLPGPPATGRNVVSLSGRSALRRLRSG